MHKIARRTGNDADLEEYRVRREEVKRKLRESQRAYVRTEILNEQNAMCIPRKEATRPVYTTDTKILADEFNIFFTSVGPRAAEKSKKLAKENNLPVLQRPSLALIHGTDEIHFRPIPRAEIRRII